MRVQKIIKHGNSLAVVIPVEACEALALKRGAFVVLRFPTDKVIMLDFASYIATPESIRKLYKEQHHTIYHGRAKKTSPRSHR